MATYMHFQIDKRFHTPSPNFEPVVVALNPALDTEVIENVNS
jgi:hypothetical protein